MDFPCTRCGLCCRMLKAVPALATFDNGAGVCRHLADNLCAIYATRPLICNAAAMYEAYFKGAMTEDEFIAANREACRAIGRIHHA